MKSWMLSPKLTLKSVSLLLMLLLLSVNGCAKNSKTELNPINPNDIYQNDKGDWCMTEEYLRDVLQVKIGN